MAYLSLKYCRKNVKTYAGNLGHLTMCHIFFVVIDALKISMTFLVFSIFFNPEDYPSRSATLPSPTPPKP